MAKQFDSLADEHIRFINAQRIFFVCTAAREGRINVSPKGQDSLRVLGSNEILWLNLTGSGNESAAHTLSCPRITLMWCAFAGVPTILRVYGKAAVIYPRDEYWERYSELISPPVGARQYFRVEVDLVQTSCGYGVPLYEYQTQRDALRLWAEKRGTNGIRQYWAEHNSVSIDGLQTGILADP